MANAVQANVLALYTGHKEAVNAVYNIACGEQATLNEMTRILQEISGKQMQPCYRPERPGDMKHYMAADKKIATSEN